MLTITAKEFEENFDKYFTIGQEEEIEVTDQGKVLFYITPERVKLLREAESMFGCLPREAYYDTDIDRE